MAVAIRSFLLAVGFFLISLASFSEARHGRRPSRNPTVDISKYSPTLFNGSTSLTKPSGTLKYITLGRGTQNYTCEPGSTTAPTPIGAIAKLIDASALLPLFPAKESAEILNELPSYLFKYDFAAISNSSLPVLGCHYFANTGPAPVNGTPTFDLGPHGFLTGKKTGDIKAPGGVGVDWLQLVAKEPSTKLTEVYRVQTVKGQAPKSCAGQPETIEMQYAAQYWFYG